MQNDAGLFSITTGESSSRASTTSSDGSLAVSKRVRSTTDSMFTSRVSTGVESSSSISSLSTNISDSTVTAVFSTTIGAVSQIGSFFSCSFVSSSCSII